MNPSTPRQVLSQSGIVSALPLGAIAAEPRPHAAQKVVVIGSHPRDPEAGCGGTIARYTDQGHEVVAVYLTRGQADVSGKTPSQAVAIGSAEARAACQFLKARPVFAEQTDGATEVTPGRYAEFARLIASSSGIGRWTVTPTTGPAPRSRTTRGRSKAAGSDGLSCKGFGGVRQLPSRDLRTRGRTLEAGLVRR